MQRYCPKCFKRFEQDLTRCPDDGEKLVLVAEQDLVGTLLDERYRILSKLGEGGMGTVYVAEQAMIGRRVALKVLRGPAVQDESSVKRFLTEAKAIASLKSAHTVTLHDFGVTQAGLLYYTMELLEGAPLSKVIKDEAPMDWARSIRLLLQVCKSLEEAHDKGILHRDIKPDNLFITWGSEGEHVTVLDFGIAKLADATVGTITKTGMICGTPAYLSPEQAQGYGARKASDLYSLGVVFYEMLAGEPPFSDTTAMRVLMKHVGEEAKPVSVKNPDVQVPESVELFVRRVLRKNPEERHQDVPEFRRALNATMEAAAIEGTVSLPSLGTSADGLRSITSGYGEKPEGTTPMEVDPLAGTLVTQNGEADAVIPEAASSPPSEIRTGTKPQRAQASTASDAGSSHPLPGPDTLAVVRESRGLRPGWGLWGGIAAVVAVAAAIGVWRPWEGSVEQSRSVASGYASPEGGGGPSREAADVAASPAAVPVIAAAPAVARDVVDVTPAEDASVAAAAPPEDAFEAAAPVEDTAVAAVIDVTTAPDRRREVAIASPAPDAASTADAAPAAAVAVEEERRAEERRRRRLTEKSAAERRAARRAAARAAAEAAAKAAAKKAAEEAAARAAAAAAAEKAAEEAAMPGLGFRKVTVEKKPDSKKGSGLGFRKINVEEK